MRTVKLALLEIKRFRTPLQRLALAFIVLVPLLYGGLYLWSNWNPYGELNRIPVAVVDQDRPVSVNGQNVDAGKQFADELRRDRIFDWHFVNAAEAARGVADTDYYFQITVPADFSRKLASGANNTPERARMLITLDDANGYIVGKMAQTVQSELQSKISAAAVSAYFESVFTNLDQLRGGLDKAADGAARLRDGAAAADKGAGDLAAGIGTLKSGADMLAPGAQQVSGGVSQIAGVVVPAANTLSAALPGLTTNATNATSAADSLAGLTSQATGAVAGGADSVQARITALGQAHPEIQADPGYQALVARAGQAAGFTNQVAATAGRVKTATDTVNGQAQQLARNTPNLQSDLSGAASKITQLDNGAKQVASGAARLDTGLGSAAGGATTLHDGTGKLVTGATQLTDGLNDARGRVPSLSDDQKRGNAATLASPVSVDTTNLHPAVSYGRGLTPFFFGIALIVFGITAFLVLRPISARALASRASNLTVALAGWLPATACCVTGGLVLFAVLDIFLGLAPVHTWITIGLVVLAAMAFTAIAHLLRTALGGVASAIILLLLLLQLTTAAGTFPYETLPAPFRALHPLLPMTYFVDGLRVSITGGNTAHLVRDILVLAGFLLAALALTVLVTHRKREWTVTKLKPDLSI